MADDATALSRVGGIVVGLGATTVTVFACALLRPENVMVLLGLIVLAFLSTAVLLARIPLLRTREGVTPGVALLITSLCTGMAGGLLAGTWPEPLVGRLQEHVSVDALDASAVAWTFTDAQVLPALLESADVYGKYGVVDHAFVAPLVAQGREGAVHVFVVANDRELAMAKLRWTTPLTAVRVQGFGLEDFRRAAARVKVPQAASPVFVRIVDRWDPLGQVVSLLELLAVCAVVLSVASLFGARRGGAR